MAVAQIIMDYWQKIINIIKGLDSNIINAMIQSLATLLAVAVGFLFSTLTEWRQWKRSKSEQIRSYQLSALLELTYQIQKVLLIIDDARCLHNELYNNEKRYANTQNMKEVRKNDNISSIQEILKPILDLKCEINKKVLELRLLKYKEKNIKIANECLIEIDNLLENNFKELFEYEIDKSIINNLEKKLDFIIEEAENGLRQ